MTCKSYFLKENHSITQVKTSSGDPTTHIHGLIEIAPRHGNYFPVGVSAANFDPFFMRNVSVQNEAKVLIFLFSNQSLKLNNVTALTRSESAWVVLVVILDSGMP